MPERVEKIEEPPSDVSLMLRAHAELRCLSREVIPVLRQLETRSELPEEQVGAALAYLEVTWLEAGRRALETDCAHQQLRARCAGQAQSDGQDGDLYGGACRYYDAVKLLRSAVRRRVAPLLGTFEMESFFLQQSGA